MNKITISITFLFGFLQVQAQTQLIPELSLSNTIGAFSEENFSAQQGIGAGLHIDKLDIWKNFGLGLYVGYNQNESEFNTLYPNAIDEAGFTSQLMAVVQEANWSSLQFGLGPFYNLNLTDKLSLRAYSKLGIARVSYPDYRYYVSQVQPVQQEYTLFQTSEPQDLNSNFNFMLLSGLRLNYNLSQGLGLSLGVNYLHIKGLTHTFTARDINITGNESPGILFEALENTPAVTKTYECNINSINATIGVVINLGGGSTPIEDPVDDEPEPPFETQAPEQEYNCENLVYLSPGYNEHIILGQNKYTAFQWSDENLTEVTKDKQYQLVLYKKENGKYIQVDKHMNKLKREFRIEFNPEKTYPNNELFWQIVPIDNLQTEICPEPTKMMRLLIFKTQSEADELLPQCLITNDEDPSTDAFKKYGPKQKNYEKN